MIQERSAKDTLTAIEMIHGETLRFRRFDGVVVTLELVNTGAAIIETTLQQPGVEQSGAKTVYGFWAEIRLNGRVERLEREVGSQHSFYEPWEIDGVRVWLDAVDAIFDFMNETHGPCRPQAICSHGQPSRHQARFALQDASVSICPEPVLPWCPLPTGGLRIEDCYRGEDCWMGPYDGASAHGGLDINHPKGTPLYAPIGLDDEYLYNSVALGHNNNRWRGVRRWPNGAQWVLRSAHMVRQTVPERQPLKAGQLYAEGAGVRVGRFEHSHFAFEIFDYGELIRLDPWILFWQMYRDDGMT